VHKSLEVKEYLVKAKDTHTHTGHTHTHIHTHTSMGWPPGALFQREERKTIGLIGIEVLSVPK